jgi:CHAT domain-containing protein
MRSITSFYRGVQVDVTSIGESLPQLPGTRKEVEAIAKILKLNAEWVLLSACNTAAEDKPGAEALSGLARAFFYAGARSLIVSHWSVDDEATARLMARTFQASARDAKLSHAEALRQSMLAMIDQAQSDAQANPQLWAPFVVVGEPAKSQ